ncbi:MAG: beta-propeller domain-containing protein [Clostridia bacterium]|nr:beta-propeller domain-containing protein [Clostridia bacterium]
MKLLAKLLSFVVAATVILTAGQFNPIAASSQNNTSGGKLDKAVVLYVGSPVAYVDNIETRIDETNPDVMPVIKNSRTLLPVRFISEKLGAKVDWNSAKKTVTISHGQKTIKLVLGSSIMTVGDTEVKLEAAAEAVNGRTLIPLRALAEALGKKVFYDRGLIIISDKENIYSASADKTELDAIIARVNKPPVVGSNEALRKLLERSYSYSSNDVIMVEGIAPQMRNSMRDESMKADSAQASTLQAAKSKSFEAAGGSNDYSTTNIQVQGVDEADVVKTDGEYIYQVNRERIIVAKAYPAESLELISTVSFGGKNFNPQEIYVDAKHLIVIGTSYLEVPICRLEKAMAPEKCPPPYNMQSVKAVIFDITDKKNIRQLREVELEGGYVSSRKIGSSLYLISSKSIWNWVYFRGFDEAYINRLMENELKAFDKDAVKKYNDMLMLPSFRDTAQGDEYAQVDYSKIYFFPDSFQANYMTIAAVNLDKMDQKADISTYLGAGQNIYASAQNLYVAVTNHSGSAERKIAPGWAGNAANTLVYKFSLTADSATYLCKGEVPGTILNQFSMDENGKYFRIATTKGDSWRNDEFTSQNNVYVLDEMLNITGKLENLAPGERIYSVRFMGDRAYVVTFKTVDPLFAIDLKDPSSPKVLGALKIPGYSDYLHPYDDRHIIGFGKDTVEIKGSAYYLGMKLAIFDVSDVSNPKEKFTQKIGDRGTESELLHNHKALLFSKEKNLLAFPVTLMEIKNSSEKVKEGFPQYGQFTFQGAYVYNIDMEKGFTLKGRITHISDEEYAKAGSQWYDSNKNIQRIIYIGDNLYTLSNSMIKANQLNDLKEKKSLIIP